MDDDIRKVGGCLVDRHYHGTEHCIVSLGSTRTGIAQVMERVGSLFIKWSGAGAAQLLHMRPDTQRKPHVMAEGADIGACITVHPEENEPLFKAEDLDAVDAADPQGALYRTLSWRPLIDLSGKFPSDFLQPFLLDIPVKPHKADIFLVMPEQVRCEPDRIPEHHEQDPGDLRVKGS
jgi:hypothetical protein